MLLELEKPSSKWHREAAILEQDSKDRQLERRLPAEVAVAPAEEAVEAETHRETQGKLPAFSNNDMRTNLSSTRIYAILNPQTHSTHSTFFFRSGPKKVVTAEQLDADLDAYNTNKVRPFKR